jgi:hypothetical protein
VKFGTCQTVIRQFSATPKQRLSEHSISCLMARGSVPCGAPADLEQLALNGSHPGHHSIQFAEQMRLLLLGGLETLLAGVEAKPLERHGQPLRNNPEMMLQVHKLATKTLLFAHGIPQRC